MTPTLTLKRRVTVWSAAVVALSLLICGGGGAWFLYHQTVDQLDAQLGQVAAQFFEQRRLHGGPAFDLRNLHELAEWLPPPGAGILVEVERGGTLFFRSAGAGAARLPDGPAAFHFVDAVGWHLRIAEFAEDDTTLRIAVPDDRVGELMRNLAIVFAVGFPTMVLTVIVGGRIIARQALAPVRDIADSAEHISSSQLDRRVPVPSPPDEIRRLALVLNATLDRLEASFEQAQRFSADASHELKTPLTLLQTELESLLTSPTLTIADRRAVAEALETVQRLTGITTTLLLLARADAGRLSLDLQAIDLTALVRDCLDDARIMAEAAGLSVTEGPWPSAWCRGDPIRLRQIVSNLLDNAVKYNRPSGRIRVSLTAGPDWCHVDVASTGPGIRPEDAPHLFDRFYRAEHHAPVPGQGLGLAIARELAHAHGGTLELVASDPDNTVFRLAVPALAPAEKLVLAG